MVRKASKVKFPLKPSILAFQLDRQQICSILEFKVKTHRLSLEITQCEQDVFSFLFQDIESQHIFESQTCKRWFKEMWYHLLGLPLHILIQFIQVQQTRRRILQSAYDFLLLKKTPFYFDLTRQSQEQQSQQMLSSNDKIQQIENEMKRNVGLTGPDEYTPECHTCHTNQYVKEWREQTRSCDEGMTNKYKCTNCGSQWVG